MKSCLLSAFLIALPLAAQNTPALNGCQLLPASEVARVTGQRNLSEPTRVGLGCGYDNAQVLIYSGDKAEASWEQTMKTFGHDKAQRFPVAGLGEGAYSFYPKPRDQYEDSNAFVVAKKAKYLVAMSVA